jgi:hypothetical protein
VQAGLGEECVSGGDDRDEGSNTGWPCGGVGRRGGNGGAQVDAQVLQGLDLQRGDHGLLRREKSVEGAEGRSGAAFEAGRFQAAHDDAAAAIATEPIRAPERGVLRQVGGAQNSINNTLATAPLAQACLRALAADDPRLPASLAAPADSSAEQVASWVRPTAALLAQYPALSAWLKVCLDRPAQAQARAMK